ncbi:MAG: DNRLRE domain-containing protein, partial [Actinomycetota bacterium]|nr:DNRLRE domain-containing protein [Actinomycetota bacterium]
ALPATAVQAHWTTATGRPPVDQAAPTAPSSVSVTVSGSTPTVSWAASTDDVAVSGYDVHRSTTSGFAVSATTRVGSATGTTYTDAALPDGTYYYRVVARDAAGNESTPSAQVSAVVSTAPAPSTVVSVAPSADSYANQGAAGTNYGSSSSLASRGSSGYASYLRFAVPAAPSGQKLTGAELRFRTSSDSSAGSTDSHSVGFAGDGWTESGLTWNNRPALVGSAFGTITGATATNTAYRAALDVSALQNLPGTTRTVAVTSTGKDSLWFWSRNHSTSGYRPLLVLTYS